MLGKTKQRVPLQDRDYVCLYGKGDSKYAAETVWL